MISSDGQAGRCRLKAVVLGWLVDGWRIVCGRERTKGAERLDVLD